MKTSVVIPTHNRLEVLKKCLLALDKQNLTPDLYDVLIIDDGSNDGTERLGDKLFENLSFKGRYLHQAQRGPSFARNKGIKEAKGDIILLIGDDILSSPDLLKKHLSLHQSNTDKNLAVIGKTLWDPQMEITPFMHALEQGIQFSFNELKPDEVSFKHCYTSNVSVPKHFLESHDIFFSEDFPFAAYEDIEWGYRLYKAGISFYYEPDAVGFHHHPVTLESYSKRMVKAGRALFHLCRLQPDMGMTPKSMNTFSFYEKTIKAKLREFFLSSRFSSFLQNKNCNIPYTKWIKSILSYYEWKGYIEESETVRNKTVL